MVVVQIESLAGVENLEGIASVPGLDVVCLGPAGSLDLDEPARRFRSSRFRRDVAADRRCLLPHGVATGMVEREPGAMKRWYDMGMRFLCCNNDGNMIYQSATRDVAALREFMQRA